MSSPYYSPDLGASSFDLIGLVENPFYYLIYVFALVAKTLSKADLHARSRAIFLERRGLEPPPRLPEGHISRSRAGRHWAGPRRCLPFCWRFY